ncbi:MAG TPA: ferredoxin [Jatrophihabitans sp.]|jgi:ferredoxin
MGTRLLVDTTLCVGTGMCAQLAPEAVEVDTETHKARPLADEIEPGEDVREAIDCCPTQALRWEDA